jgi:D-3-phosphoglycerate dehydrogenase
MHCFVAGRLPDAAIRLLERVPHLTYEVMDDPDHQAMHRGLAKADLLLLRATPRLTAEHIEAATALKVVSRYGVGYDNVDVDALSRKGIPLAIAGDSNSTSVAEGAFNLMISLARKTLAYDSAARSGDWTFRDSPVAEELGGKQLLIIGYGRIGRKLAKMARGFEMTVKFYDPALGAGALEDAEQATNLDASLAQADFVSVNCALNSATADLLDSTRIGLMKKSAYLVNTARAGVVNEAALLQALNTGTIAGAGIDVFAEEPLTTRNPFVSARNTILSPHAAGLTVEAAQRMSEFTVNNALNVVSNKVDWSLIVNADAIRNVPAVA